MPAHTFYLDQNWDITLDTSGRLLMSMAAYAIAQIVANAVRLFTNEAYFAMDEGIPHFDIELGRKPLYSVLRGRIKKAALGVDGVLDAVVHLNTPVSSDRKLTGDILLTVADEDKTSKITVSF